MQQETPQPSQPAPLPPVTPVTPPQPSAPQEDQGAPLYRPAAPAPYAPAGHTPSPQSAPDHTYTIQQRTISWHASEYVHNDKGTMWLVSLGGISLALIGIALFLQAWTFLVLIVIMAVAMGIFAFRQPHVLQYTLNDEGVQVGDRMFRYNEFRAFGILEDGAFFTLMLIPVKRFAPSINVYFADEQGEDIVDIVGAHLPMEHIEPDIIDHIMRRLRF